MENNELIAMTVEYFGEDEYSNNNGPPNGGPVVLVRGLTP